MGAVQCIADDLAHKTALPTAVKDRLEPRDERALKMFRDSLVRPIQFADTFSHRKRLPIH
jgi:hypothetical protein